MVAMEVWSGGCATPRHGCGLPGVLGLLCGLQGDRQASAGGGDVGRTWSRPTSPWAHVVCLFIYRNLTIKV